MLAGDTALAVRQKRSNLRSLFSVSSSSNRAIILGIVIGLCLSLCFPAKLESSTRRAPDDPSYNVRPSRKCDPPIVQVKDYAATVTCVRLVSSTSSSLTLELTPHLTHSEVYNLTARISSSINNHLLLATTTSATQDNNAYTYSVTGLTACTEHSVSVETDHSGHPRRRLVCTARVATACTPPVGNLLQNPSFESAAEAPFIATRREIPGSGRESNARQWTPFYDGGARRVCGIVATSESSQLFAPRSGNCALLLGHLPQDWSVSSPSTHKHYGAHTAVPILPISTANETDTSPQDNFQIYKDDERDGLIIFAWTMRQVYHSHDHAHASLVVAWTLHDGTVSDGVSVPLPVDEKNSREWNWRPVCVRLPNAHFIRIVHVFFHLDAANGTETVVLDGDILGVDDVSVFRERDVVDSNISYAQVCHSASVTSTNSHQQSNNSPTRKKKRKPPCVHLRAEVDSLSTSVTLAVPLTADRVLRLERLSRAYGGGGISAAVVVRTSEEANAFTATWYAKAWLRRHVNVTFVRRGVEHDVLPLNAVRNIAVSGAQSEFVAMLDVDMIPSENEFACMRGPHTTKYLGTVLPRNERVVLTLPVLLPDIHMRPAHDKPEARSVLLHHAGYFYCVNSQRGSRLRQWFTTERGLLRGTRFLADYEPYVIARRELYAWYDERFEGYGFNKISWLMTAEANGWRSVVTSDAFVTHLNHVEMEWVSAIRYDVYIQTWRRYIALAAEMGDFALGGKLRVGRTAEDSGIGSTGVKLIGNDPIVECNVEDRRYVQGKDEDKD